MQSNAFCSRYKSWASPTSPNSRHLPARGRRGISLTYNAWPMQVRRGRYRRIRPYVAPGGSVATQRSARKLNCPGGEVYLLKLTLTLMTNAAQLPVRWNQGAPKETPLLRGPKSPLRRRPGDRLFARAARHFGELALYCRNVTNRRV